jgi:outer membrane protein
MPATTRQPVKIHRARTSLRIHAVCRVLLLFAVGGAPLAEAAEGRPILAGAQTLRQLQTFALEQNPEVAAGGFDRAAAQARRENATGAHWPKVSIEGGYTQYDPDLRLTAARFNGEPGVFGDNIMATDLVLRLPLYAGGRLVAEVKAAELLEASSGKRLASSKADLLYNVASLYYGALAQERLIAALESSERALAGHLDQVRALIGGRKAAAVDGLRAEVKLADVRQRLLRERNILAVQRQSLLNLAGASGAAPDFTLADELSLPSVSPSLAAADLDTLVAAALARRPDISAAHLELDAQAARIESARAGHWPTVNLVAATGNRRMRDPVQQPTGLSNSDNVSRIGITFEIPLFEGGRMNARVDEEQAKYNALRERFDRFRLQVRLDVTNAAANLAAARERAASSEKAVALARKVTDIEREKYALGRGTELDVLDAESALVDAAASYIRALADANTSHAQLRWATGENLQ